ncbi:unnamed protein product [Lactuca virosa]|uniref:Ribonucloprotein n=1 Tax=Lactuca virosa TaxID=75947 RepID=A0AAU9NZ78_9ASTR|nr:unnamed protein product [Lactuca virosa]CAH1443115.1 unnamed protein product [Lactuca virosa]CAH1443116.1 unnamed protein product [Lactuca virosa]
MGDNQQQQQNYGSNRSDGKTSKATVMPANRKHVSTMMAEKTAKVIASTAKHIKNKNKINPGEYGNISYVIIDLDYF